MAFVKEPVLNNVHMPEGSFIYSDGIFDYCIVNGESLTKYFGSEPGEYESYPIHMVSGALDILNDKRNFWMRALLKYDSLSESPLYQKKQELLSNISRQAEEMLF